MGKSVTPTTGLLYQWKSIRLSPHRSEPDCYRGRRYIRVADHAEGMRLSTITVGALRDYKGGYCSVREALFQPGDKNRNGKRKPFIQRTTLFVIKAKIKKNMSLHTRCIDQHQTKLDMG